MTVCIQDRRGDIHIIGWTTGKGNHYTLCDKFYRKDPTLNIFAVDNTFRGVCSLCHKNYETMYKDDLEFFIQLAHGQLREDLVDDFQQIEKGHVKLKHIYEYLINRGDDYTIMVKNRYSFRLSYFK